MFDFSGFFKENPEAPDDMQLGVVTRAFENSEVWRAVLKTFPWARIVVLWDDGKPVSKGITMRQFRHNVMSGNIHISITEGEGGVDA